MWVKFFIGVPGANENAKKKNTVRTRHANARDSYMLILSRQQSQRGLILILVGSMIHVMCWFGGCLLVRLLRRLCVSILLRSDLEGGVVRFYRWLKRGEVEEMGGGRGVWLGSQGVWESSVLKEQSWPGSNHNGRVYLHI